MQCEYYIDEFRLSVHNDAYLIFVRKLRASPSKQDGWDILPEWIFRSRNSIWFLDENAPIHERARKGDEIKRRLDSEWKSHASHGVAI